MDQVLVTVLVCTRSREQDLRQWLPTVIASVIDFGPSAELLVVDNGSSDGTQATLAAFSAALDGQLRVIPEPRPGKTIALNTGASSVHGGGVRGPG